jgi:hypothetical protein
LDRHHRSEEISAFAATIRHLKETFKISDAQNNKLLIVF